MTKRFSSADRKTSRIQETRAHEDDVMPSSMSEPHVEASIYVRKLGCEESFLKRQTRLDECLKDASSASNSHSRTILPICKRHTKRCTRVLEGGYCSKNIKGQLVGLEFH